MANLKTSIGLLILRLGVGGFMVVHGYGKLQMLLAGQFDQFGDPIGIGKGPSLVLATMGEFLGSLLVMLGLFTRCAAIPVVITMGVAAFVVHAADPWDSGTAAKAFFAKESETWFSKEPALIFGAAFLALVFTGGGGLSLDALWRRWRAGRAKS